MVAVAFSYIAAILVTAGTGVYGKEWQLGCFSNTLENVTYSSFPETWNGPGHCTYLCKRAKFQYAAIQGDQVCHCLESLQQYKEINGSRCNISCPASAHMRCGGFGAAISIFNTSVPIVFNHSLSSPGFVAKNNVSKFVSSASLTHSRANDSKISNYTMLDSQSLVNIFWSVDKIVVKAVSKFLVGDYATDTFTYAFTYFGAHTVCNNISNEYSWIEKCRSVVVIERINTLEIIAVDGGKHSSNGKYAILLKDSLLIDVVVNAGSFADLHFDFGEDFSESTVAISYSHTMKNCTCLALTRKTHRYKLMGVFSLNVTAVNNFGGKELIFNDRIVVDGKITGCKIVTKFVPAGKRSRILVETYGEFKHVHFNWTLPNGAGKKTEVPYLDIDFSNNQPQFPVKVTAFNNVSKADANAVLFIEPEIKNVSLQIGKNGFTVNEAVIFTSTVIKDDVLYNSVIRYTWILGNGERISGTIPNLIYKYKKSGRYQAQVHGENFIGKVQSNYITVNVYEIITWVEVRHKPFKFGETTEFTAFVEDGTDLIYTWDFGDNTFLATPNNTVYHKYESVGNYSVKLMAANPVSSKEDSIVVFVLFYDCQKPSVSFSRLPIEESIRKTSELRIDVDVSVSCSRSNRTTYSWKLFAMEGGQQKEISYSEMGLLPSAISERSLVLPAHTLLPGRYRAQLTVRMEGTIVFTQISKIVAVLPSKIQAVIHGGKVVSVGRKSHQNFTLDASSSYDPDDRNFKELSFAWVCRSIVHTGYGSCFKTNTTMRLNWTTPTFQFLPKMLTKSSLFAFIVTVSRGELRQSTAIQFVKVEEGELQRLHIRCNECHHPDVNVHNDIQISGNCSDCDDTPIRYQWKFYSAPKIEVFLRLSGKCIPSNGSAWDSLSKLNHTNTSTTKLPSTSIPPTILRTTTVSTTAKENLASSDFQRLVCETELNEIKKGATSLEVKSRKRRTIPEDNIEKEGENVNEDRGEPEQWGDFDGDDDLFEQGELSHSRKGFHQDGKIMSQYRFKRDLDANNSSFANDTDVGSRDSDAASQNRDNNSNSLSSSSGSRSFFSYSSGSGAGQSADDSGNVGGSGSTQSTSSGRGAPVSGTGSGRPLNSRGSGQGCEESLGLAGGGGGGSGRGSQGGCSGNKDGFGEGAKAHQNKTGVSNTTGTVDKNGGPLQKLITKDLERQLKDELAMIREIMHPVDLSSRLNAGQNLNNFIVEKDSLVPGQLYMVEFTAWWKITGKERIAGQAKSYFLTNTGPFLGSCHVFPLTGKEFETEFSLKCTHWKDEHFPLKFSVQYKMHYSRKKTQLYFGLSADFNFTLPAGNASSGFKVDLEVFIEDAEGVRTNLCPIPVQVWPLDGNLEEYLYNQTVKKNSLLQKYEDLSDEVSAMTHVASSINSLNRLPSVYPDSSKFYLREEIRRRLLKSILKFPIQSEVFALQLSRLTLEVTRKNSEISFESARLANAVLKKIISSYKRFVTSLSVDMASDLYIIVSDILFATSRSKMKDSKGRLLGSLVKETLRLQDNISKNLQRTAMLSTDPIVIETDFLTSVLRRYRTNRNRTLSSNGCSFVLPQNMASLLQQQSKSFGSTKEVFSTINVYRKSPYFLGSERSEIETKVASLDFRNSTGASMKISNLSQPIEIKLPVTRLMLMKVTSHSISIGKINVHEFNLTKSQKSTLFVKVKAERTEEIAGRFALQALVRFNEPPTQNTYNTSLKFDGKIASAHFSQVAGLSKVFVGVFFKTLGRVAKKARKTISVRYNMEVFSVRCNFWNESEEIWSDKGCQVAAESTTKQVVCKCNHLTAFGGHVDVLNDGIEVRSLVTFARADENNLLLVVVLSVICLYLVLLTFYGIGVRSGQQLEKIAILPDNHPADLFRYLVITETGSAHNAGTTARVSVVVYGKEGHSQIRELTCPNMQQFKRGSTDCVIMSFPDSLGDIKKIKLWHDNGGYSPNWFLKQITIVDYQTEKAWYFPFNNWLAIADNTRADCEIHAEMEPTIYNMQAILEGMLDYHLWISVFTRPSRSSFSASQRLTVCLTAAVGYMFMIAILLRNKSTAIFGIWDVRWQAILCSIITAAAVFPVQLVLETLFRCSARRNKNAKKDANSPVCKDDANYDKDVPKSNGAVFFMEVNSALYSSQNILYDDENESISDARARRSGLKRKELFELPAWCQVFWMLICVLLSTAAIVLTIWYGNSFLYNLDVLWVQALALTFMYSLGILEVIKASALAIKRLLKMHRKINIEKYLGLVGSFEDISWNQLSKQDISEPNEKQIMAARARSRFVRFSKPILNDELKKARKKVTRWIDLSSFLWNLSTTCVYSVTLMMFLVNSNTSQHYLRQESVRNMILRPVNSTSFENITTPSQFWDWAEIKLVRLLNWRHWYYLRDSNDFLYQNHVQPHDHRRMYTFGPASFEKEESGHHIKGAYFYNKSSSTKTVNFGKRLLLMGTRHKIIATVKNLRSSQWISNDTTTVKISYCYFHPETSLFSYVQLFVEKSFVGRLNTRLQIGNALLFSRWETSQTIMIFFQILSIMMVMASFHHQISSLLDKKNGFCQSKWNIIETMLIIITFLAIAFHAWFFIESKKALYQVDNMHFNDKEEFLDLVLLLKSRRMLEIVYATLLFLVLLRSLKLLRIWRKFAVLFSTLDVALSRLSSFMIFYGVLIVALFHVGTLILAPSSRIFSKPETSLTVLWSVITKDRQIFGEKNTTDSCLYAMYKIITVIAVFACWRMSAVLFIGEFKAAKATRRRKTRAMKAFKIILKKIRSKKVWLKILNGFGKRIFRKQEDKYIPCDLPLENVYEEIEYQVEEVIFRLSNLFDMTDLQEQLGKTTENDDDYTLDSSEEAAYPSSYSAKDSISFTSESINSEDSGFYRYGEYRCRYSSTSNSDDEYEGPIIHHLDPPRQRLSSLGQMVSPIFGGRYFVKTSWSTFRPPKIQPIEIKPPPKIELPESSSRKTFEKLSNWPSKLPIGYEDEAPEAYSCDRKRSLEIFDVVQKSKMQPSKLSPLPRILPPQIRSNNTFEKIRNWKTDFSTGQESEPSDREVSSRSTSLVSIDTSLESYVSDEHNEAKHSKNCQPENLTNQQILLPKALQSMAHNIKLVPKFDTTTTPFRRPPRIPPLSEMKPLSRKRIAFKKTQVLPLDVDMPHLSSYSSDSSTFQDYSEQSIERSKRRLKVRSPSLDSGIMRSSENDESELCDERIQVEDYNKQSH